MVLRILVALFAIVAAAAAPAAEPTGRSLDTTAARATQDRHLGVATCAGSACHGASRLRGGAVRQDEYLRWQRDDDHARAFTSLRNDRSRRIAANLGIQDAAAAPECLTCHADVVPAAGRGERFQLSDGVGCETCHGAAERWLSPHVRGYKSHAERLAHGLYPTWEPAARAELCLSCHQGDARRPMTHAIMGAGHPPLLFELDTFTALQPAHFDVDADYIARKGRPDDARLWITGQATAARVQLAGLAERALGGALFPELAFFDCNACHHPMQPARWQPQPGFAPGRVRVADASFYLTALWLEAVKPDLAARWREELAQLHEASGQGATELRARAAAAIALLEREVLPLARAHAHDAAQLRRVALLLLDHTATERAGDFSVAEQTAMATAVFATALGQSAGTKPSKALQDAISQVYAAVENRDRYEPEKLRAALRAVREQMAKK
ncbi:MAG TPA: multiheme c-type cytochrome [Verrucomicrobiae bacterium]|nr:multiheme c-type cytochrome [Verrucomicrobiae bacterium]